MKLTWILLEPDPQTESMILSGIHSVVRLLCKKSQGSWSECLAVIHQGTLRHLHSTE